MRQLLYGKGASTYRILFGVIGEELVRVYRQLPERQRQAFLSVVRAMAGALAGPSGSKT